ncbi:MAG: NAD-dependent epimerase/dehydratase family protein [Propionibacteriaceae bacterium]|nr:NAD-dependent epimerase/dehydratase family protein [Propionibacteriaceae bacterium]
MHVLDSDRYRRDIGSVADLDLDWSQFQDTQLVLSGASGMIGSFVVDVLMTRNQRNNMNCTVHALARDESQLENRFARYRGSSNLLLRPLNVSTDRIQIDHADFVVHAASNTHPVAYAEDPIGTILTNVDGTHAMLDLAVRAQARRFVFLSTVEIYGENRGDVERFRESDLGYIDCNTLRAGYPESKRTGEALCQAFAEQYGTDVVVVRLPRVFGPTMRVDDTKALSQFLLKAVTGQDIVLKSEGKQYYSYCHVADAVSAILTVMASGESGQAYNVADPSYDVHLGELADLVATSAGQHVVFELPNDIEQRGFSPATMALMDGTKLAQLGWHPLLDIVESIHQTLAILKETIT